MEIIRVSDVYYEYENPDEPADMAVKGVSLTVQKGEWLSIIGHNGSGKSTLVKLLNGLFLPKSGAVLVDNIDTRDEQRIWDVRQKVGMIFQNPDNQMVATIVEEDVAFGLENLGVPPQEIQRRVYQALKAVGMTQYAASAPHMLSGGQKQRVAIARALANNPKILLCDEPTSALDSFTTKSILKLLQDINQKMGVTIIIITHEIGVVNAICDKVAIINYGTFVEQGEVSTVMTHPASQVTRTLLGMKESEE